MVKRRLALAYVLIRCIRKDIANPAGKARLHIREPLFIDRNVSRSLQFIAYFLHFRNSGRDADFLHPLRRQLNWRERGLIRLGGLRLGTSVVL